MKTSEGRLRPAIPENGALATASSRHVLKQLGASPSAQPRPHREDGASSAGSGTGGPSADGVDAETSLYLAQLRPAEREELSRYVEAFERVRSTTGTMNIRNRLPSDRSGVVTITLNACRFVVDCFADRWRFQDVKPSPRLWMRLRLER